EWRGIDPPGIAGAQNAGTLAADQPAPVEHRWLREVVQSLRFIRDSGRRVYAPTGRRAGERRLGELGRQAPARRGRSRPAVRADSTEATEQRPRRPALSAHARCAAHAIRRPDPRFFGRRACYLGLYSNSSIYPHVAITIISARGTQRSCRTD